jgi:hypothetical protein
MEFPVSAFVHMAAVGVMLTPALHLDVLRTPLLYQDVQSAKSSRPQLHEGHY